MGAKTGPCGPIHQTAAAVQTAEEVIGENVLHTCTPVRLPIYFLNPFVVSNCVLYSLGEHFKLIWSTGTRQMDPTL